MKRDFLSSNGVFEIDRVRMELRLLMGLFFLVGEWKNGCCCKYNGCFSRNEKTVRWSIKSLTYIPQIGLGNDFIKNWKTVSLQLITRVGKGDMTFLQSTT
jgi:hypothetical protein